MKKSLSIAVLLAATASASIATTFKGRISTTVGSLPKEALVYVSTAQFGPILSKVSPSSNGSYTLEANVVGSYTIHVVAPNYTAEMYSGYVRSEQDVIEIDATLSTNIGSEPIKNVAIITQMDEYNRDKALVMKKMADGSYEAYVEDAPQNLMYQILVETASKPLVEGHSINGTQHQRVEYDLGGDFFSVNSPHKTKSATIVFNPSLLPASDKPGSITNRSPQAQAVDNLMESTKNYAMSLYRKEQKPGEDFQNVFERLRKNVMPGLRKELLTTINTTSDDLVRDLTKAQLFATIALVGTDDNPEVRDIVVNASHTIKATSLAWQITLDDYVKSMAAYQELKNALATIVSLQKRKALSDEQLSQALYQLASESDDRRDTAMLNVAYKKILSDFPGTMAASLAKKQWSPDRKIVVGNEVPTFTATLLNASGTTISPEKLRGKWVLIDLWATWCGPCVAELPTLTKTYEKFKSRGLEILSISLDQSDKAIADFRAKRFPMPWLHVFEAGVFESTLAKHFEVVGIPKPILVDPNGKIVAISNGLRGSELEQTLDKYLPQ